MSNSTFVPVSNNLIRSGLLSQLKPTEFIVWLVLRSHCSDNDFAWPKHATIAKLAGVGVSTVKRAVTALEKLGIIESKFTGRFNAYKVAQLDQNELPARPEWATCGAQADQDGLSARPNWTPSVQTELPGSPNRAIATAQNGLPKEEEPFEEEPRRNPPPPKTVPAAGKGEEVSWTDVGKELHRLGLNDWRQTVRDARSGGLSVLEAMAVIQHFDPAKWSVGGLAWRLRNGGPGVPPGEGWPKPKATATQRRPRVPDFELWRASVISSLKASVPRDDALERRIRSLYEERIST